MKKIDYEDFNPSDPNSILKYLMVCSTSFIVVVAITFRIVFGYNPFPLHSESYNEFLQKIEENETKNVLESKNY